LLSWTICRFRIRGFYFAIGSMLIAEILMSIVVRTRYLGRGMGITFPAIDKPFNFQFIGIKPYYYVALVFVCLIILIAYSVERSRLGWYLRATRQSEEASSALGISVTRMKVVSMTLSAFLTGVGGGIYVLVLRFCSPYDVFGIMFSVTLMLGTLLGGRATVFGPIVGTLMLTTVKEGLTFAAEAIGGVSSFALVLVVWGIILCLVAKYLSRGIVPWVTERLLKISPLKGEEEMI
jgi:branched-chain amino acid transport system permease protein